MKPDHERVKVLLLDTIALLCKNGLSFKNDLKIQGLLAITIDEDDVFIVHMDESISESPAPSIRNASAGRETQLKLVPEPVAEFNQAVRLSKAIVLPPHSASKRKRLRMEVLPVKQEKGDWSEEDGSAWGVMQPCSSNTELEDQNMNDNSSDSKHGESDDLYESSDGVNFESHSRHGYDAGKNMFSFSRSANSSHGSNIRDAPASLNSPGMILKAEDDRIEIKSEDTSNDSTSHHSTGRKKSNKNSAEVPYMVDAAYASPVNSPDDQWQGTGEVISYPIPTAVCWDNEDESFEQEDDPEWSNWEKKRRPNKKSTQSEDREKSFVCQYDNCDKAFFRKDHLIRHQRSKHGKPFGVDSQTIFFCHVADCGKTFYKNTSLHRHMSEAHGYSV